MGFLVILFSLSFVFRLVNKVGLIYVFNLIVGTGALALPAAFARAGWFLSTFSLLTLAFMGYVTATYVLETMACANAVDTWKAMQADGKQDSNKLKESDSKTPSVGGGAPPRSIGASEDQSAQGASGSFQYYSLDKRIELGAMANMFFNKTGRILFYATICIYLYGDLAIYTAALGKTVMDVICSVPASEPKVGDWMLKSCFNSSTGEPGTRTRQEVYHIALLVFVLLLGPFVFYNVQKTKYMQIFTTCMRWLAFTIMITWAVAILVGQGAQGHPPAIKIIGLPKLFGACVYSFMCHHSLPGLITPIRDKTRLGVFLSLDYAVICVFYLLLAFTGGFAFASLADLYTLNFVPMDDDSALLEVIEYFLALFPVFTLSTSFPIIAITLRNNLMTLFLDMPRIDTYSFAVRRIIFPIVTVIPPVLLTCFVHNIGVLIEFTGSFAGTGIQYFIPTFLVVAARRHCTNLLGSTAGNPYQSPLSDHRWAVFVLVWSFVCLILVTIRIIEK